MSALFSCVMRFVIDAIRKLHSLFVALWLLPVRFYRRFLSGWKPPSCRFRPTCSAYAIDAVNEWGILIGAVLTVCRIFRCNPFSRGGYDPVPKRADFLARLKRLRKK